MKNLATSCIPLENNLENARTSHDTGKTPLINYVIGDNKKKKNFREKTRNTRITWNLVTYTSIVMSERRVSYKSINKFERKKCLFRSFWFDTFQENPSEIE